MELLGHLAGTTVKTILDVLTIAVILAFFQVAVVPQHPPYLGAY
jgi:hypothetical protein